MSSLTIDLKDCKTVLEFLDTVIKTLKLQPFYGTNLEVLGKTLSSLEKYGFAFPLRLELLNTKQYQEKCPTGWKIFLKLLQKAQEEYDLKKMKFEYKIME
ncbi:MAG: barstar family protein [Nanoarchaeota archaeon]|nr:barstar family protein [Nanoarchaeota archaeon]